MNEKSAKDLRSKTPFRFQQFTVRDDRTAMKVGTDGVLLGAWAPVRDARVILDVGTGSGLVALMIAQRTTLLDSKVLAIDIEEGAAIQAVENFRDSPWHARLPNTVEQVHVSYQQYVDRCREPIDLVVSNPPFFEPAFQFQNSARQEARTTKSLDQSSLFDLSRSILATNGRLCLILPYDQAGEANAIAQSLGFELWTRTDVRPTPTSKLKRVLLEFGADTRPTGSTQDELVVEESRHQYSNAYEQMTKEFHLRYA